MTILDLQVGASGDDLDRPPFNLVSLQFLLDFNAVGQEDAARFTSVTVPQGDTVIVAYVTVTASFPGAGAAGTTITAEDADDPGTFTDDTDFLARSRTGESVHWDLPVFTKNITYRSPSLVVPIQAVIKRAGFAGNALVLFFRGDESNERQAFAYDSDFSKAVQLHIEHTAIAGHRNYGWVASPPNSSHRNYGPVKT